jgi:hypothetical protein
MVTTENCQNCNALIDCACQKVRASDGKEICDACYSRYEASLKIKACADNMRSYLKENNQEENHCVILYVFDGYDSLQSCKVINRIYKNVDEFELKVDNHINEIDPMLGIDFQLWILD